MATIDDDTFLGSVEKIKDLVNEGDYADATRAENLEKQIRRALKQGIYWFERQRDIPYMYKEMNANPNINRVFETLTLWRTVNKVELWEINGSDKNLIRDLICASSPEQIPRRFRDNIARTDSGNTHIPKFYIKYIGYKDPTTGIYQYGSNAEESLLRTLFKVYPVYDSSKSYFGRVYGYARSVIDSTVEEQNDFTHFFFTQGWDVLEAFAMMRVARYLEDTDLLATWASQFSENYRAFNIDMDSEMEGDEYADEFRLEYLGENMDYDDLRELPSRRN